MRWISRIRFWLIGGEKREHDQKAVEVMEAKVDSDAALDRTEQLLAGYVTAERRRRTR